MKDGDLDKLTLVHSTQEKKTRDNNWTGVTFYRNNTTIDSTIKAQSMFKSIADTLKKQGLTAW